MLYYYETCPFYSKSLSSSQIMDVPDPPWNSTDRIAAEFQKAAIQTVNRHVILREAWGQFEYPRAQWNDRLKTRPNPQNSACVGPFRMPF
jgi:hypothetical protein